MRDIKFRAKSLEGELVYFDLHESHLSGDPDIVFYVGSIPCKVGTEQQYTGRKDKNGKEIYEDDIISLGIQSDSMNYGNEKLCLAKVIFQYGHWYGESNFEHTNPAQDLYWLQKGIEVIGNIYANPELVSI